jgi:hypothetical protein
MKPEDSVALDRCECCGEAIEIGQWPFCPHERGGNAVVPDDIPGGQWFENGFDTPQKFYSHSAHRAALAANGCEIRAKWAGPGATEATLQLYGGTATVRPDDPAWLTEAKKKNLLASFRALWHEEHYPGWLKVVRSDPEGERSWHEWTRVGYIKWLKPEELHGPTYRVEAA